MERNPEWTLERAVERWGRPYGVEEARKNWSKLVYEAAAGIPTLITCGRPHLTWAVLVPLAELYEPQGQLRAHTVSNARPKLATLIRDAQAGTPQLLYRRYTAVAAVMTADLMTTVAPGDRLDVDELLRAGATITLTYDPGAEGRNGEDGEPAYAMATAVDPDGGQIGIGIGGTAAQAPELLHPRPHGRPIEYATEAPAPPLTRGNPRGARSTEVIRARAG